MALCSNLGMICKKLISPLAKAVTESIHIPGGISTAFSLAFIVTGALLVGRFGAAMIMSLAQCGVALALGSVGSLGMVSIVAYLIPGLIIDVVLFVFSGKEGGLYLKAVVSCALAGLSSCLISNLIIFHLTYPLVLIYCFVAFAAGALGGVCAGVMARKVKPIISQGRW